MRHRYYGWILCSVMMATSCWAAKDDLSYQPAPTEEKKEDSVSIELSTSFVEERPLIRERERLGLTLGSARIPSILTSVFSVVGAVTSFATGAHTAVASGVSFIVATCGGLASALGQCDDQREMERPLLPGDTAARASHASYVVRAGQNRFLGGCISGGISCMIIANEITSWATGETPSGRENKAALYFAPLSVVTSVCDIVKGWRMMRSPEQVIQSTRPLDLRAGEGTEGDVG